MVAEAPLRKVTVAIPPLLPQIGSSTVEKVEEVPSTMRVPLEPSPMSMKLVAVRWEPELMVKVEPLWME